MLPRREAWTYTRICASYYTREVIMPTNLAIDDRLLQEAQRVGGQRTDRETVNAALEEYIRAEPA